MAENISPVSGDEKIKGISDYLRNSVLDPAEKQKNEILQNAEEEKKRIIKDAELEAEKIITNAKNQAEHEKSTLESSLRIAAKKAVDALKLSVEKEILTGSVDANVKSALSNEEIVKQLIVAVSENILKENTDAEVVLSEKMKANLADFFKSEIASKTNSNLTLSSDTLPGGFAIKMKDSSLMFDFTEESVVELMASFLRPEIRKYLFEK